MKLKLIFLLGLFFSYNLFACSGNGLEGLPDSARSGFNLSDIEQFAERASGNYVALENRPEGEFEVNSVSEEDLMQATSKVGQFLGDARGEEAIKKLLGKSDTNGDGKVFQSELKPFLAFIGLGNGITRGYWAEGILDYYGTGSPKYLDHDSGKKMLIDMELY